MGKNKNNKSSLMNLSHPTYFCFNKSKIKVFVLGADPSNNSDKGKTKQLTKVFAIGDGDARYFSGILSNLKEIGLCLEDIYVQNLITEYFEEETTNNKDWEKIADQYVGLRKKEFDKVDKTKKIPVLITAERIYKYLLIDNNKTYRAEDFYNCIIETPFKSDQNKLGRPIIPFYRHKKYNLKDWQNYKYEIIKLLK